MMETPSDQTREPGDSRTHQREPSRDGDGAWGGDVDDARRGSRGSAGLLDDEPARRDGYRGRHSQGGREVPVTRPPGGSGRDGGAARGSASGRPDGADQLRRGEAPVARRTATGWRVGDEEVSDLTSAMVLADLLAADLPAEGPPTPGSPAAAAAAEQARATDIRQLQETVAQLEHALTVRVRVEQAIGVLAERHRLRPRQAFELLRSAARSRGRRVLEVAGEVVDSATNPLLRIPEELAKPPAARRRGRMSRRGYGDE